MSGVYRKGRYRPIPVSRSESEFQVVDTRAQRNRHVRVSASSAGTAYQGCPVLWKSNRYIHLENVTRTRLSRTPYKTRATVGEEA